MSLFGHIAVPFEATPCLTASGHRERNGNCVDPWSSFALRWQALISEIMLFRPRNGVNTCVIRLVGGSRVIFLAGSPVWKVPCLYLGYAAQQPTTVRASCGSGMGYLGDQFRERILCWSDRTGRLLREESPRRCYALQRRASLFQAITIGPDAGLGQDRSRDRPRYRSQPQRGFALLTPACSPPSAPVAEERSVPSRLHAHSQQVRSHLRLADLGFQPRPWFQGCPVSARAALIRSRRGRQIPAITGRGAHSNEKPCLLRHLAAGASWQFTRSAGGSQPARGESKRCPSSGGPVGCGRPCATPLRGHYIPALARNGKASARDRKNVGYPDR